MGTNEEYRFVQYINSGSVLVINPEGRLRRVYVPFQVFSNVLKDGKRCFYTVDEVNATEEDKLVYIIAGKAYFHHLFTIDISF